MAESPASTTDTTDASGHAVPAVRRREITDAELLEVPTEKRQLLAASQIFLSDEPLTEDLLRMTNEALVEELQQRFQRHLEDHYERSGLKKKVVMLCTEHARDPAGSLDEEICHLVAQNCGHEGTWTRELPVILSAFDRTGYNCTLGSAMLQTALQDAGFTRVHTVLRAGHYCVIRELDDGSLKLLDATSLQTEHKGEPNERLIGYVRTFPKAEVVERKNIPQPGGREGFAFTLRTHEKDSIGGLTNRADGGFEQSFFANDPSIKIDIGIALENLSEIKLDAAKAQEDAKPPLAIDAYKEAVVAYLMGGSNATPLDESAIVEIAEANFQPINELVDAAQRTFEGKGPVPDPYAFLESPSLSPNPDRGAPPDPRDFSGSSEHYREALRICERYPLLYDVDFAALRKRFNLFHGYDHLKKYAA
jgi:hypothetical protein